ncbi:MAG: hypothetical protein JNN15_02770 [Blastocatellia bacterium]|nr:hypothetical protein [Blastocatellia bacterium]
MKIHRSILSLIIVGLLLAFATSSSAFDKLSFSGTWTLSKEKSSNLPSVFVTVDEYNLIINQTSENISFQTEFRGRGQTITGPQESYTLDGTTKETKDSRGVTLKRSMKYDESGQKLLVETEKEFTGAVQLPKQNDSEVWELSGDGSSLTITITPKSGEEGKQVRVFTKKN